MSEDKPIKVELYTSNICPKCKHARQMLTELVSEIGNDKFELEFIDVVKNIDRSVQQGVLTTPSLVIDHQLVSSSLPNRHELSAMLKKYSTQHA
jgi:glutaredoxin